MKDENDAVEGKEKIFLDVFDEIEKCVADTPTFDEFKEKLLKSGDDLLKIHQVGLARAREEAKRRGKEWTGRLILLQNMREQDEWTWWECETVEIGKKTKSSLYRVIHRGNIEESEHLEIISSNDGAILKKIRYRLEKTFNYLSGGRKENIVLHQVTAGFRDNQIRRVEIERNIDAPPAEPGSFNYCPAKATVRHEVCL